MTDLDKAYELLRKEKATCVIVYGKNVYVSRERGVKPLLKLVEEKRDVVGASAADKVVGKAAAMLYVTLGVKELHACVISELALELLKSRDVTVRYDKIVFMIRNRTNTGFCPMEQSVKDINDSKEGLSAIKAKLQELEDSAK